MGKLMGSMSFNYNEVSTDELKKKSEQDITRVVKEKMERAEYILRLVKEFAILIRSIIVPLPGM